MTDRQSEAAAARLKQVHERIEQWRSNRTKRSRIPQDIWQDATILGQQLGVYPVARALRLDYQGLRRRVEQRVSNVRKDLCGSDAFVELSGPRLVGVGTAETVIEISDKRGAQVTVRLTAHQPVDVIALVDRFLGVR